MDVTVHLAKNANVNVQCLQENQGDYCFRDISEPSRDRWEFTSDENVAVEEL